MFLFYQMHVHSIELLLSIKQIIVQTPANRFSDPTPSYDYTPNATKPVESSETNATSQKPFGSTSVPVSIKHFLLLVPNIATI